jgi:hypothetical protein
MKSWIRSLATLVSVGVLVAAAGPAAGEDEPTVIRWATYFGGANSESILALSNSGPGEVTIGGYSFGPGFPVGPNADQTEGPGSVDAIAATFGNEGSAVTYSSYLGGNSQDAVHDVAADPSGAVYLVGEAHSSDFPTTPGVLQPTSGGSQDAFVVKLAADGTGIEWSTLLGGESGDIAYAVDIGPQGSVYVTGRSSSTNFPTTPDAIRRDPLGRSDIFIARLSPDGTRLEYGTLFGGSNTTARPSSGENARAIAVDDAGAIYLAGVTDSSDFPVALGLPPSGRPLGVRNSGGLGDAFVAKIVPGQAVPSWSGYLGGVASDSAGAISVDEAGVVHVGGSTDSPDFPVFLANQPMHGGFGSFDGWVAQIEPGGAGLGWSTFHGGNANEGISDLAVNDDGTLWLSGRTSSANLPTTVDALQASYGGGAGDGFLAKMLGDGSALAFSTFLGGSGDEGISGLARIDDATVIVGGGTDSTDFPVTAGAMQGANAGGVDLFIASVGPPMPLAPEPTATCRPPGPPSSHPPHGPPPGPACGKPSP